MRHPFWSWASWLSLGLAGCLHGFQDRQLTTPSESERLDASKPIVAGQSPTSADTPSPRPFKVNVFAALNPLKRKPDIGSQPNSKVVPQQNNAAVAVQYVPPPAPPAEPAPTKPAVPKPAPQRPTLQRPTTPKPASKQPALGESGLQLQPAPNRIAPPTATSTREAPQPFAEFERAIPLRSADANSPEPNADKALLPPPAPAAEEKPTDRDVNSLPVIIIAPRLEPESPTARPLLTKLKDQLQESPPVPETATPNRVEAEPTARPRDVAVLVEQVFENLRQRRIGAARERTEQLRHLVANSAKGARGSVPSKTAPGLTPLDEQGEAANSTVPLFEEPATNRESRMLDDDAAPDKFFDDDKPVNQ